MADLRPRTWTGMAMTEAYARWVTDLMAQGWNAYFVTLMFHDLPGSRQAQIAQMHRDATAAFSRLATRMVRKPRSAPWVPQLPIAFFAPDLPVPKRRATPLCEPPANDGLHLHGIILTNGLGRLREPLDRHFQQRPRTYLVGKLRTIDVRKIKRNPEYTTDYALKGLKHPRLRPDHLLVLPRSLSELPHKVLRSA
jgi:hypothetical protein